MKFKYKDIIKLLVEFGPLIVFFATFKLSDIFVATGLMLVTTIGGLLVSYLIDKKISLPLLISGSILIISGVITIVSGDSKYIKMKPTIVYGIFGLILYIGTLKQKGLVKEVFSAIVKMEDQAWITLSWRFAIYFFVMAIINEIVWRNYSEDIWVNFKIFGFVPLTLLFIGLQAPFIHKNRLR